MELFKPFDKDWADDNIIYPYKERAFDINQPIFVYRNLHKKGYYYSIKQKGYVIAHCTHICLKDVSFSQNKRILNYSKKLGKKLVHSYIKGLLTPSTMGITDKRNDLPCVISYNENSVTGFRGNVTNIIFDIKTAMGVIISENQIRAAYTSKI